MTLATGLWIAVEAAGKKNFTVVIDAGHGGHDAGASGAITNEKDINLGVALKLGKMLEKDKDIKVVYTRNSDKFVTLQGRADIANRNNGDLFISIHTNSVDRKSKTRNTVNGAAVYTLGPDRKQDNLSVAMRENSVMKLERDFSTAYQGFDPSSAESYIIFEMSQNKYMQNSVNAAAAVLKELCSTAGRKNNGVRQANFWVLLKTAMPAMLVELDFICNPDQEKFMASESGQQKLAEAIYRGTMAYRGKKLAEAPSVPETKATAKSETNKPEPKAETKKSSQPKTHESAKSTPPPASKNKDAEGTVYKIQFLTSNRVLKDGAPELKGLSQVDYYTEKGIKKYTYGTYPTEKATTEDLKKIKTLFPDAFVITFKDGKRIK